MSNNGFNAPQNGNGGGYGAQPPAPGGYGNTGGYGGPPKPRGGGYGQAPPSFGGGYGGGPPQVYTFNQSQIGFH